MKTETLEQYNHITLKIKELTDQKKELAEKIQNNMTRDKIDTYEADFGKFYLKMTPSYEYSDAVKNMDKLLKESKKREIDNGTAILKQNKIGLAFRISR